MVRLQDADLFLRAQTGKLVVIDEIHRAPALFEVLRGIIDDRRAAGERTGHFLLLGSAAIDLMRQASETLAGRVDYVDLSPIDALELPKLVGDVNRLWIRGGFPESLLAPDDVTSLNWRRSNLARDVLKPRVSHLVHGGSEAWPMAEGVTAIALVDLMRKLVKSRPRP